VKLYTLDVSIDRPLLDVVELRLKSSSNVRALGTAKPFIIVANVEKADLVPG
jgi:hypothetical protein